jgi:hypothetical protein
MESRDQPGDADQPFAETGDDWREARGGDEGFEPFADAFDRERLRLGSSADTALAALIEAGPEALDHLLKAAQEFLLAAKAVVDAGERAVEAHRDATDAAAPTGDAPGREARVRRIDLG